MIKLSQKNVWMPFNVLSTPEKNHFEKSSPEPNSIKHYGMLLSYFLLLSVKSFLKQGINQGHICVNPRDMVVFLLRFLFGQGVADKLTTHGDIHNK